MFTECYCLVQISINAHTIWETYSLENRYIIIKLTNNDQNRHQVAKSRERNMLRNRIDVPCFPLRLRPVCIRTAVRATLMFCVFVLFCLCTFFIFIFNFDTPQIYIYHIFCTSLTSINTVEPHWLEQSWDYEN